ncbi:hypothetical protein [Pelagibacterium sp.]|uniref:hypothetical protein n=1 Tax=Pelagibacterium sp. TaxID=1967288 RepID=UPI003A8D317E
MATQINTAKLTTPQLAQLTTAALFNEWLKDDYQQQDSDGYAEIAALMLARTPVTAQDLARQIVVASDNFQSIIPDDLKSSLMGLALRNQDVRARSAKKADFEEATVNFKAAAMAYDPTILGMGAVYAGENLDRLDLIMFSRDEKFAGQFAATAEGGAV